MFNLFHRHKWINYKAIPEYGHYYQGYPVGTDGTAVFQKCKCGKKRKMWYQLQYKIVDGFLVNNI